MQTKIFIAGHKGFVGSALLKKMQTDYPQSQIITRNRAELDLLNQQAVFDFLKQKKPDLVVVAAAKVGGIMANMTHQADFLYQNLQIQNNLIHGSFLAGVNKLLFLGSSCIYPRNCSQPMKEEYLMTGDVEPTNYGYAVAKIAGLKMCQAYKEQYGCNFFGIQPTNLYGPGDSFDENHSHAMAGIMRKMHDAKVRGDKTYTLWGTGTAMREWLYIDDMIDAIMFILKKNITELVNIGVGQDISIIDLANKIAKIIDFKGNISLDTSKPDGMPKKLLDVSKMSSHGWFAKTDIEKGIINTYNWFKNL